MEVKYRDDGDNGKQQEQEKGVCNCMDPIHPSVTQALGWVAGGRQV